MVASVNDTRAFRSPRADTDPALRRCRSRGICLTTQRRSALAGSRAIRSATPASRRAAAARTAPTAIATAIAIAPGARDRFKLLLKHARANSTGKILQVARASQASAATAVGCLAAVDDVTSAMRSCQWQWQ